MLVLWVGVCIFFLWTLQRPESAPPVLVQSNLSSAKTNIANKNGSGESSGSTLCKKLGSIKSPNNFPSQPAISHLAATSQFYSLSHPDKDDLQDTDHGFFISKDNLTIALFDGIAGWEKIVSLLSNARLRVTSYRITIKLNSESTFERASQCKDFK